MVIQSPEYTKAMMGQGGLLKVERHDMDNKTLTLNVLIRCVDIKSPSNAMTKGITAEIARHILTFDEISMTCPGCAVPIHLGEGSVLQTGKDFHWVDVDGEFHHAVKFSTRWK